MGHKYNITRRELHKNNYPFYYIAKQTLGLKLKGAMFHYGNLTHIFANDKTSLLQIERIGSSYSVRKITNRKMWRNLIDIGCDTSNQELNYRKIK